MAEPAEEQRLYHAQLMHSYKKRASVWRAPLLLALEYGQLGHTWPVVSGNPRNAPLLSEELDGSGTSGGIETAERGGGECGQRDTSEILPLAGQGRAVGEWRVSGFRALTEPPEELVTRA